MISTKQKLREGKERKAHNNENTSHHKNENIQSADNARTDEKENNRDISHIASVLNRVALHFSLLHAQVNVCPEKVIHLFAQHCRELVLSLRHQRARHEQKGI